MLVDTSDKLEMTISDIHSTIDILENNKELGESHGEEIRELTHKVHQLMNSCQITFLNLCHPYTQGMLEQMYSYGLEQTLKTITNSYPVTTTEVIIACELDMGLPRSMHNHNIVDWTRLDLFPFLKKLTIHGSAFGMFYNMATSSSIEHLIFKTKYNHAAFRVTFEWMSRFPNLCILDASEIQYDYNIGILDFLPECPKLKCIHMHTASRALINYCKANRIDLHTVN